MAENRSHAVRAQRHEPKDSLDDFPTPCWATRALLDHLGILSNQTVREPAANRGHMVRPLAERFHSVEASDVKDYGAGFAVSDYLFGPPPEPVDWTITNPPFRLAEQFIDRAMETSTRGVAMLLRVQFIETLGRYERLFSRRPPVWFMPFVERVPIARGRLMQPGDDTATAYAWFVFVKRGGFWVPNSTQVRWIGPCRASLERDGDYDGEIADFDRSRVISPTPTTYGKATP